MLFKNLSEFTPARLDSFAKSIRELISKEDELVNRRILWHNAIQGLLIAALAWVQKPEYEGNGKLNAITYVIAAVGIYTALNTVWTTHQANMAIKLLLMKWRTFVSKYSAKYPAWHSFESVIGLWAGAQKENPLEWTLPLEEDVCETFLNTVLLPWHPFTFAASWIAIIFITAYY